MLCHAVPCCTMPCCTTPYSAVPCHTLPSCHVPVDTLCSWGFPHTLVSMLLNNVTALVGGEKHWSQANGKLVNRSLWALLNDGVPTQALWIPFDGAQWEPTPITSRRATTVIGSARCRFQPCDTHLSLSLPSFQCRMLCDPFGPLGAVDTTYSLRGEAYAGRIQKSGVSVAADVG